MHKRIYKSMRLLAIVVLLLATVLTYFVASGMLTSRAGDRIASEAQLLAASLKTENAVEILAGLSATDKYIALLSQEGDVLYAHSENVGKDDAYYVTASLGDGTVLCYGCPRYELYAGAIWLLLPTVFVLLLGYIVIVVLALRFSDAIVEPIIKIDPIEIHSDTAYPEIAPLLRRVSAQRKEIQRQADRMERQNLRFRAIGEQMTDGLVLLGRSRKINMVNAAALDAFGAKETDVLGQSFMHLCRDAELCDRLEQAWEGHRFQTEKTFCGKFYQLYCSPILQEDVVTGVLLMLFDISEKREAEQMRREFTANVSHELKSPLTSVLGYAQLMRGGLAAAEDIATFSGKIEKEAMRLLSLIDDIIELSKLDEMQEPPTKTALSLEAVVLDVTDSLADKAAARGISVTVTGDDTQIEGNPLQITELVYNLCENAIKYNKDNGSVNIELSEKTLCVSDTGIGIASQYTERIFERFFRVDKIHSRTAGGTGLGLSIVKHIAQVHGAQISVKSKPGEGTSFTVKFER